MRRFAVSIGLLGFCACAATGVWLYGRAGEPSRNTISDDAPAMVSRIDLPQLATTLHVLDRTEFDFGDVKPGQLLTSTVRIANAGPSPFAFDQVRATCACGIATDHDRAVCQPGETSLLRIGLKAGGYGPQKKSIGFVVKVNDSLTPLFQLTLSYRLPWLHQHAFVPARVDFGRVSRSSDEQLYHVQLFVVGPPEGPDPEVLELASDSPAVTAFVDGEESASVNLRADEVMPGRRRAFTVTVRIDPSELPVGDVHEHLEVTTSIGAAKLGVTGVVHEGAIAVPGSLLVDTSHPVESYTIRVRQLPGVPVRIREAQATVQNVSCEVDSAEQLVVVQPGPGVDLTGGVVEITVEAAHGSETLRVPFVAF